MGIPFPVWGGQCARNCSLYSRGMQLVLVLARHAALPRSRGSTRARRAMHPVDCSYSYSYSYKNNGLGLVRRSTVRNLRILTYNQEQSPVQQYNSTLYGLCVLVREYQNRRYSYSYESAAPDGCCCCCRCARRRLCVSAH